MRSIAVVARLGPIAARVAPADVRELAPADADSKLLKPLSVPEDGSLSKYPTP